MPPSAPGEVDRLRRDAEHALRDNLDAEDVLPLLARLARAADPDSEAWIFAHRHLAEIAVEHDPWRAALFARRVIARCPDDDGAWAVLGLSQSLLGHHRFAAHAYERALTLAPDNPWYAHNLGHLYDVALDRSADALPLLERATLAQPLEADIAASYAHALARCGRVASAKRVLKRAIRRGGTSDQMALWRWLEAGAPAQWNARARMDVAEAVMTPAPLEPAAPPATIGEAATPSPPVSAPVAVPPDGADRPGKKPKRRRTRDRTAGN